MLVKKVCQFFLCPGLLTIAAIFASLVIIRYAEYMQLYVVSVMETLSRLQPHYHCTYAAIEIKAEFLENYESRYTILELCQAITIL